jgi:AraC-like DNA-binding protein
LASFSVVKLHEALDAKRCDLGLSWSAVAAQLWEMSAELNARRPADHPISPSTLKNMATTRRTSCQHALFMLRWLDRTPESFLRPPPDDHGQFTLPSVDSSHRLRWSLKRLHAALDDKRRAEHLTWATLASTIGCSPGQLTGLRTARFATNMELAMRITQWLQRPAAEFVYAASW